MPLMLWETFVEVYHVLAYLINHEIICHQKHQNVILKFSHSAIDKSIFN